MYDLADNAYSLSVIIICRFHLILQERHRHPNGTSSSPSLPGSSFRAAAQRAHNAVVEEFGDSDMSRSVSAKVSEAVETQEDPQITPAGGIELDEFPWATGCVGDVETAGHIESGTQWDVLSDDS